MLNQLNKTTEYHKLSLHFLNLRKRYLILDKFNYHVAIYIYLDVHGYEQLDRDGLNHGFLDDLTEVVGAARQR